MNGRSVSGVCFFWLIFGVMVSQCMTAFAADDENRQSGQLALLAAKGDPVSVSGEAGEVGAISLPSVTDKREENCRRFRNGVLIFKKGEPGEIRFPFADLDNLFEGRFDLSRCGCTGEFLMISTGYRKTEDVGRVQVWITLWNFANSVLGSLPAHHYLREVTTPEKWDEAKAPVGIFWTWGGWNLADQLGYYDCLTTISFEALGSDNLHAHHSARLQEHRLKNRSSHAELWGAGMFEKMFTIHF